ncbi:MAG: EAL and HDOD domain-containing protein [Gemmatimonadaceae bacterium]
MLAACRELVDGGYRLALDDYVPHAGSDALLPLASIVKVDMLGKTLADIEAVTNHLRPSGARLLAEKVESSAVRDACSDLGYDLFQGYLFSSPETLTKTDVEAGQLAIMRLLNLLHDPTTTDVTVGAAFQSDLALCYKLLRIVNAAAVGGQGVTSIPHAIRLIGRTTLHRWLSVLLIASLGAKGDVSHEVAVTAMTRARMCELVVSSQRSADAGSAFIVGLLSLLDVLLEVPMEKILERLELSDDVRGALIARGGPLAEPLKLVEAYEHADWQVAREIARRSNLAGEALPDLYVDALRWARERVDV